MNEWSAKGNKSVMWRKAKSYHVSIVVITICFYYHLVRGGEPIHTQNTDGKQEYPFLVFYLYYRYI